MLSTIEIETKINKRDEFQIFLIYISFLLIPLAAWAYIWRWLGYLILSSKKVGTGTLSKIRINRKIVKLKVGLISFIVLTLSILPLRVFIPHIFDYPMTAYLILLYTVTPFILMVVLEIFLKRLKKEWSMLYRRAKAARVYVLVVVILLFVRGLSITMDLVISK